MGLAALRYGERQDDVMNQRQLVSSGAMWEPLVGYSRAAPDGGAVGGSDIGEQTREALRRIQAALQEAGAQLKHVVRSRLYVTDISR
jgi:enamine deaminase RidA (YjgF/YER057c/UK114 family)